MGNELDMQVAEQIMGWRLVPFPLYEDDVELDWWDGKHRHSRFHPSTDIASAWEVVEKLQERGLAMQLTFGVYTWECVFGDIEKAYGEARNPSAPEAICLAALKTVEEEQ